jgi:hypothetical protein
MNDDLDPGTRRFYEVRGGELYEVVEVHYTASMLLAVEHMRAQRIASEQGLPGPPPLPPEQPAKTEKVIAIERTERKLDARFHTPTGYRLSPSEIGRGFSVAEQRLRQETNQ